MRAPPPNLALLCACLIAAALLVMGAVGLLIDAAGLRERPVVMPWSQVGGR